MATLDSALKDAKIVADISKKYKGEPLFNGLVNHFMGTKSVKAVKADAKRAVKKAAKKTAKAAAKPRGKKGEWPAKIRAVLQEMPGSTAMDIIQALGFEKDKSKAAHVRSVLSSLKKQGKVAAAEGKYTNTSEVLAPESTEAPAIEQPQYASAE